MKNKKGFTLVELMAVIAILAIIITIAVPSAISISHKIKVKMYNTKVNMILSAAELYAQENPNKVQSDVDNCTNTVNWINIQALVDDGKIKKDDMDNGKVLNPIDNSNLNDYQVCLYKKNNRVYSKPVDCVKTWNKDSYLIDEIARKC